jgi:hypothetical protein
MGKLLALETQPVRALQQPEWDNQAQVELFRELLAGSAEIRRARQTVGGWEILGVRGGVGRGRVVLR